MAASSRLKPEIGIVVPTLGTRHELLIESLKSIRAAGDAWICLVCPSGFAFSELKSAGLIDQVVVDPKLGLAMAINAGIQALPEHCEFVNWLGDDDSLQIGSLEVLSEAMSKSAGIALVYGSCRYVDDSGKQVWINKSGSWAASILTVGPDLIPQPGALFRRVAFNLVGGLDPAYKLAFDYDLFAKLKKIGELKFVPVVLANFRWHPDSLSVDQRKLSVEEASRVRRSHQSRVTKTISWLWEPLLQSMTLRAGYRLNKRIAKGLF